MELFDIVDDQDRVTGQAPRSEVHAQNLKHRAVHIFVVRPEGTLLMQKRSLSKDLFGGDWTTSCSGHVDAGENYSTASRRELYEELGIKLEPTYTLNPLFKVPACSKTGDEFVEIYVLTWTGEIVLNPNEISAGRWVSQPELMHWVETSPGVFAPSFLYILEQWEHLHPDSLKMLFKKLD